MKEPERYLVDDPREWLNRARSSLEIAKNRGPQIYLEDLCFEAQQAARKRHAEVDFRNGRNNYANME